MKRKLFVLSLATGVLLCFAGHALAGGTVVNGPADATDADCAPGASPSFEGVGDETLIVLGCATPRGSLPVVIAASFHHPYACFYVAPPGGQDEGPCIQVRSTGGKSGGGLTDDQLKEHSSLTGGRAITGLRIGAYDRGTYVSGQVPRKTRHLSIRSDGPRLNPDILRVPRNLGAQIGATHTFSVFVGRLPDGADTCQGVRLVAGLTGERLDETFKASRNQAYPAGRVGLPGSKRCATDGAWETLRAVKAIGAALREVARLNPARA